MRSFAVIAATLAVSVALVKADYLEEDDIPSQCRDICRPVWQASARCDDTTDGDDDDDDDDDDNNSNGNDNVSEIQCICATQNFNNVIPDCELCVRPYYGRDDDYYTIRRLTGRCNFPARAQSSGSAQPTNRTSATASTGGTTMVVTSTATGSNGSPSTTTMTTTLVGNSNDQQSVTTTGGSQPTQGSGCLKAAVPVAAAGLLGIAAAMVPLQIL